MRGIGATLTPPALGAAGLPAPTLFGSPVATTPAAVRAAFLAVQFAVSIGETTPRQRLLMTPAQRSAAPPLKPALKTLLPGNKVEEEVIVAFGVQETANRDLFVGRASSEAEFRIAYGFGIDVDQDFLMDASKPSSSRSGPRRRTISKRNSVWTPKPGPTVNPHPCSLQTGCA